ncbi:tyrosine-type recombinase/integrase [Aureimonas sp. SK2]|uniref:tyrosine-type recombinase/integrase n=1 Tax=Aureimonas sp. SK2 TaxID=3015992 RepID=UPI0024446A03|nr:tyrosine-type recombinase/integrase [Aureimonas sp. SK2]
MYLSMQAVAIMLEWAWKREPRIDLQERLGTGILFEAAEIHSLRRELRLKLPASSGGEDAVTVGSGHYYNRCHAVRDYVTWHAENVLRRIPTREHGRAVEHRRRLEDFRVSMVANLPSPRTKAREGVDEEVQRLFLEAIRPGSPTNPFQAQHQARNYALLLLYFLLGVRRAEALKVKGEDLYLTGAEPKIRIVVRVDEIDDPRRVEPRAKTQGRDLPLGPALVEALREWVVVHRKTYPGHKKTPFVFINRMGGPLSLEAVNDMFELLRRRVDGLPADFTTHHLRHTANDRLSDLADEEGWGEGEEKQRRNYTFGWTKTSNQGEAYQARSTRRKAAAASLRMQKRSWEGQAK